MKSARLLCGSLLALVAAIPLRAEPSFTSPGLPPTRMDDQGRLLEDWGAFGVQVEGSSPTSPACVSSIKLEGQVPAVQAQSQYGPVTLTVTAFRGPAWPSGLDVLTATVKETAGQETSVQLSLVLPETVRLGLRSITIGDRAVVTLPAETRMSQATRDWGWADDAVAMPGWGRPVGDCDPAFRNIRAGMGGVPILYRFKVGPKAKVNAVLGFCESFCANPGDRPLICRVEGASVQQVDPVARWGQHHAGALLFAAEDANGDGLLEIAVLPKPGAPDQNPILNAIWLFSPENKPNLPDVIAGKMNAAALRYVSVGGPNDQSFYAGGRVEYTLKLLPHATEELTFLVACPGASLPAPGQSTWTPQKLRQAAAAAWRDW
jgi:hypothetical protein